MPSRKTPWFADRRTDRQRVGAAIDRRQRPEHRRHSHPSRTSTRRNADAALAYLFKNTALQTNFNVNMTCLLPAENAQVAVPSRLDLKSVLTYFLDFRLEVVTRRLKHELALLERRIHILEGFEIVFDHLDEAIKIIRASDGKADAAPKLIDRFKLTDIQADAILETKLYRLGKLEIAEIRRELAEKRGRVAEFKPFWPTSRRRWKIVKEELREMMRLHADVRRTRLDVPAVEVEYREEDYIVDEDSWVIVTRGGWIKRQKTFTDVPSIRVRDDDRVGWVYRPEPGNRSPSSPTAASATPCANDVSLTTGHGEPIQTLFAFEDNEHVVGVICHDPRCLPSSTMPPSTKPTQAALLLERLVEAADTNGEPHAETNGNGKVAGARASLRDRLDRRRQSLAVFARPVKSDLHAQRTDRRPPRSGLRRRSRRRRRADRRRRERLSRYAIGPRFDLSGRRSQRRRRRGARRDGDPARCQGPRPRLHARR